MNEDQPIHQFAVTRPQADDYPIWASFPASYANGDPSPYRVLALRPDDLREYGTPIEWHRHRGPIPERRFWAL